MPVDGEPAEPTEAILVLLLLHRPPVVRSPNITVVPGHIVSVPVIPNGSGLTVTVARAVQPVVAAV